MSESKTPRSDDLGKKLGMKPDESYADKLPVHAFWTAIELGRELELENAELKRQLKEEKRDKEQAIEDRKKQYKIAMRLENELDEYERQIKDGELIPVEVVEDWTFEHCLAIPVVGGMSLKQFAAERHRCSTIDARPSSSPAT